MPPEKTRAMLGFAIEQGEVQLGCRVSTRQSALIPLSRMILPHFATSVRLASANSSGVFAMGIAPTDASRASESGDLMILTNSSCNLLMMDRGVPAGASRP